MRESLAAAGCPSGLEPPAASLAADPTPFVIRNGDFRRLELSVAGAKCAGCIAKIEGGLKSMAGIIDARLNLSTNRLVVGWRGDAVAPMSIIERLRALGYRATPFDPAVVATGEDAAGRELLQAMAVAGFATANIMLLSVSIWSGLGAEMGPATRTALHWVSALIAVPASLYAGRPFFRSALRALRAGGANMDVPISLAVMLALGLSLYETAHDGDHAYFDAATMLLFFLLIGRWLDHRLRQKARAAARDLLAMQAMTAARVRGDGAIETVAARDVRPDDRLRLWPGDRAPVDAEIIEGAADIDLSIVTGESKPARRSVGEVIHAGALVLSHPLTLRALKSSEDSLIADLARLIETGEQARSRYVRLADRAARLYVPVVHSLAASTFVVWHFLLDASLRVSLMNAIAVLIITCPCALGLAAPAVQIVATGRLFRRGVLVKSGDALERLSEVDMIVFDKTGTLTEGKLTLANRASITASALEDAAALARASRHPLSRAIVAAAGPGPVAPDAEEVAGCGVAGTVRGGTARLGRADWAGAPVAEPSDLSEAWFRRDGDPAIRFQVDDLPRTDAAETIGALRNRGFALLMLSGDLDAPARRVGAALGLDWRARLSPADKIEAVARLAREGKRVAMVGDGLNDAPSLAGAHASLSPGAAADASQAAADFVYQGDGIGPVVEAIDVARAARRRLRENFAIAAVYNLFAAPIAALGLVTPLIAALAMSGSSLIVILNALRIERSREAAPR